VSNSTRQDQTQQYLEAALQRFPGSQNTSLQHFSWLYWKLKWARHIPNFTLVVIAPGCMRAAGLYPPPPPPFWANIQRTEATTSPNKFSFSELKKRQA
jgi:hypothetical protein